MKYLIKLSRIEYSHIIFLIREDEKVIKKNSNCTSDSVKCNEYKYDGYSFLSLKYSLTYNK